MVLALASVPAGRANENDNENDNCKQDSELARLSTYGAQETVNSKL